MEDLVREQNRRRKRVRTPPPFLIPPPAPVIVPLPPPPPRLHPHMQPPSLPAPPPTPPLQTRRIAPPVHNLRELIELSESGISYENIDMESLHAITPSVKELESMIGLASLKETVCQQLLYYLQQLHRNSRSEGKRFRSGEGEFMNMVIYGPPGSGKSQIGELLAEIFQAMKIFRTPRNPEANNTFKIAHRDDLIAKFLGQTAIKTREFLEHHRGGVVLIDEAYSLGPPGQTVDIYSHEAVDTMTAFLSENKDDICLILAGYEQDLEKRFFSLNPGLKRRFAWFHRIEKYTAVELAEIFHRLVRRAGWRTRYSHTRLVKMITDHHFLFTEQGGDLELLFLRAKIRSSARTFSEERRERRKIRLIDLEEAFRDWKKLKDKSIQEKEHEKAVHQMMYL